MTRRSNPCRGDLSLLRNVHSSSVASQPQVQRTPAHLLWQWSDQGVNLTTHLHLVMRLRISVAINPRLLIPYGKHRENFTFTCLYLLSIPWRSEWCFLSRFLTILHMRVVRPAHPTTFEFSIPKIFCDQCNYEALLVFSSRSKGKGVP